MVMSIYLIMSITKWTIKLILIPCLLNQHHSWVLLIHVFINHFTAVSYYDFKFFLTKYTSRMNWILCGLKKYWLQFYLVAFINNECMTLVLWCYRGNTTEVVFYGENLWSLVSLNLYHNSIYKILYCFSQEWSRQSNTPYLKILRKRCINCWIFASQNTTITHTCQLIFFSVIWSFLEGKLYKTKQKNVY